MQVYSTVSFRRKLNRWFVSSVIFAVLIVVSAMVWAREVPPKVLMDYVNTFPIVHSEKCKVKSLDLDGIECYIMFDQKNDVVWVLLYDDNLFITRVLVSKNGQEKIMWCRSDVCT